MHETGNILTNTLSTSFLEKFKSAVRPNTVSGAIGANSSGSRRNLKKSQKFHDPYYDYAS